MSATSYSSLFPLVLPYLVGVPDVAAISAFNQSARELCRRSKCWSEWQDIQIMPGVSEYSLDAASSESSVRVVRAVIIPPSKTLSPLTSDEIIKHGQHLLAATGEPTCYVINQDMSITLYPAPAAAQTGLVAKARVSFVPNSDSTKLPADLIERFEEVLVDGCKSRLFAIPGMAWSDPQQAMYYKQAFQEGVTKAEIELMTDYGSSDLTVQKRRFI